MSIEHWNTALDVIEDGKALVERERTDGIVSVVDAAAYALDVLRVMAEKPHLNVQLHHELYRHVNDHTRTGQAVRAFYSLAIRTAQAAIDPKWERVCFQSSGMVGDGDGQLPTEDFDTFLAEARATTLPDRFG